MTKRERVIIPVLLLTVAGVTLYGSSQAFAQDANGTTLAQKIADKFGLNKNDVQAVFDQARSEHQADMETKYEARLTQLVTEKKITDAQKKLILAKHKELEAKRQSAFASMKDKTPAERKTAMEAEKKALDDWAKQNGIDVKYLMGGFGGERGMRGFGHKGMGSPSPTPAQ
jgi:hypothetical protein